MHVLKSMNRKDLALSVLVLAAIGLLCLIGIMLVGRSLAGAYSDLEVSQDSDSQLPEASRPAQLAALDYQILRQLVSVTKQPASRIIGGFCVVAFGITVALVWLWHKLVFLPISSAANFLANYHDPFYEEAYSVSTAHQHYRR